MLIRFSDIIAFLALLLATIALYFDYRAHNRLNLAPTIFSNLIEYSAWNDENEKIYKAVGSFKFSVTNNKPDPIFIVSCQVITPFGGFGGGGIGDKRADCPNFEEKRNGQYVRLEAGETRFFEELYDYSTATFHMNDASLQIGRLKLLGHSQSFIDSLIHDNRRCEISLGAGRGEVGFTQSCEFTQGQVLFSMILKTGNGQAFREDIGIFGNWPWGETPNITSDLIRRD